MSFFQHKLSAALLAGVVAVAAGLGGCAGNGDGLNSTGQPIGSSSGSSGSGSSSGPFTADFESIQENVFTPICSPCHSGANAPHGLMLDAAHSYTDLVGVASVEVPTFDRVKAGDPDNSYIILKLEDSPLIAGAQMPLNETPLTPAVIAVIRQWITNGAPPASTAAPASVNAMLKIQQLANNASPAAFSVTQTAPLDRAMMEPPVHYMIVAFNHEVDASLVNYTNLTVEQIVPGTANEPDATAQLAPIPAYMALADGNPNAIIITPVAPLLPGAYRVTVRGTGGGALADLNAQVLGGDYSFTFNVDASP
jgi:hypothetical protein